MNERDQIVFICLLYLQYRMMLLPPPPVPPFQSENGSSFFMILNILITYIRSLKMPLPFYNFSIRNRILEHEVSLPLSTNDPYRILSDRPFEFWIVSGETVETFENLLTIISPRVRNFRYGNCFISLRNRLLMTLMWLRQYPTYTVLSLTFGVSVSAVGKTVNKMWMILWEILEPQITWPSIFQWNQMRGNWPEMANVIGPIDGTSHEIWIPSTEPQEEFYSGHRKFHCIHTQIVIDNQKNICYVHSGFLGHNNDAFCYQQIRQIGPGLENDFPAHCFILADSIYPNAPSLVTPFKCTDIVRRPRLEQKRKRKFNLLHRKRRVYVEHVIKELKDI